MQVGFNDNPITQSFAIQYQLYQDPNTYTTSTYSADKVKSLLNDTRIVTPNTTTINAPLCSTTGTSISFTPLPWKNNTTNATFGTITTYDYFIPSGWTVAGQQSQAINGAIHGTNNETITPDNLSGTGQTGYIRVANSCGFYGTYQGAAIPLTINRPQPQLTTAATNICNGNYDFNITNLPSGSTTSWSYSSNISVVGTQTASQTTVTRNASTNASGYVQAVITLPCTSTTITKRIDIPVGLVTPGISWESLTGTSCEGDQIEATFIDNNVDFQGTIDWYWNSTLQTHHGVKLRKWLTQDGNYIGIKVFKTGCGYSDFYETFIPCDNFSIMMAPNPTSDLLTVSTKKSSDKIYKIQIADKMGTIVKQLSYTGVNTAQVVVSSLNPDIYTVQVYDGSKWAFKKLQIVR